MLGLLVEWIGAVLAGCHSALTATLPAKKLQEVRDSIMETTRSKSVVGVREPRFFMAPVLAVCARPPAAQSKAPSRLVHVKRSMLHSNGLRFT
eukprot:1595133-Amphidinium_carterae.1